MTSREAELRHGVRNEALEARAEGKHLHGGEPPRLGRPGDGAPFPRPPSPPFHLASQVRNCFSISKLMESPRVKARRRR